jgi:hypothetical protein
MIVEPVPTNPRSPLRRILRVAGVALPLVLLVGVVAAGALGPRPDATRPDEAAATPATGDPASTPRPATLVEPVRRRQQATFPAEVAGLPVRSVVDALSSRAGDRPAGIVAVGGYLSLGALPWTCLDAYLDPPGTTCIGRTLMQDWFETWGQLGPAPAGIRTDLLPRFRPGTRGPIPANDGDGPRGEPVPVVLLGSFAGSTGQDFIVERVAWVAGEDWDVTLTIDPALDVEPNIPEVQASVRDAVSRLGGDAIVTMTAVVRPDALAAIDPEAAAALPPIPAARRLRPVTYVRGLQIDPAGDGTGATAGATATVTWIVLDSITGEELAAGRRPGVETSD